MNFLNDHPILAKLVGIAALALLIGAFILVRRLERSWIGLNLDALRLDDEQLVTTHGPSYRLLLIGAGGAAAGVLGPGSHGTTFGGSPLVSAAGIATLRALEEDKLLENAATVGAYLKAELGKALTGTPGVREVRGQGLMLGIELEKPCGVLTARALEAGLKEDGIVDARQIRLAGDHGVGGGAHHRGVVLVHAVDGHAVGRRAGGLGEGGAPRKVGFVEQAGPVDRAEHDGRAGADEHEQEVAQDRQQGLQTVTVDRAHLPVVLPADFRTVPMPEA